MAKFEYDSKVISVEAYGQTLPLAKKTPQLVEKIGAVSQAKTLRESFEKTYDAIGDVIGVEMRNKIFPSLDDADTDELSCFWLFLCGVYRDRVNELTEKYQTSAKKQDEPAS